VADDESISAERIKHLELVQGIVTRLSTNSFFVKGWAITITTALLAFQANKPGSRVAAIAFLPILAFWLLDSYFLRQERLFRRLYEDIRRKEPAAELFSMDIRPYGSREKLSQVSWSITIRTFYGLLLLLTLLLFAVNALTQK
jgi:hypothetical protein